MDLPRPRQTALILISMTPTYGQGSGRNGWKPPRFPFGLPKPDNANYLWIQTFYSALCNTGRAGFVMANSASDAGHSELAIRRKLIEERSVDVIISVATNMFYTVTLPVTLWFLDRGKKNTGRSDHVLFIDAREIYNQIDRAHRDWTPQQTEFLANIVRLWRGDEPEFEAGSEELLSAMLPTGTYTDVAGLCALATIKEIQAQGWSLNPGRYVGAEVHSSEEIDFVASLEVLREELVTLSSEALRLTDQIMTNLGRL